MAKIKITKSSVDAAQPKDCDTVFWDDRLVGFGLKVTPTGRKVFIYRYRAALSHKPHPTTFTIGRYGNVTAEAARKFAETLAGKVAEGRDPQTEQKLARKAAKEAASSNEELAFDRKAAQWLEHYEHEKGRRPSSVSQARLVVKHYLSPKFKDHPLTDIGRTEIQSILDSISPNKKATKRSVFAYASVFFSWAVARGDIPRNPLTEMVKPEPTLARDRVLSDEELFEVWKASANLPAVFGSFYRLLILTGQRREEVATLRWQDLDRPTKTWLIPRERAKNGVAHVVPLSASALTELDLLASNSEKWPQSGYVLTTKGKSPISGFSKAKRTLDLNIAKERGAPLPEWRIHDLRRTLATGLQRLGVRFEVTEAVLNHVSGAKSGVAGIYQRHDWASEKRNALDAWAKLLQDIKAKNYPSNVVPMMGRQS